MKRYVWAVIVVLIAISGIGYGYLGKNRPMVSVVMLTYKRADILPNAIESILAQTYQDFEFIILNDGSPDNTDEVIAKYQDPRIRYYKNAENKGIAYSRNRAASLAHGKYIMIMDDDDISLPERMQKQVAYLENNPEITVVAGQIEGLSRVPETHDDIASGLIQYNNFGNANIMYCADFAKKHNIKYKTDIEFGEDWYFWLQMLFAKAHFASIKDEVTLRNPHTPKHYRVDVEHLNNQVRQYVGSFFSPSAPDAFYEADACGKLRMIALKNIFSKEYQQNLFKANSCAEPD
ncbi:MAG: glycosyltransferase family 2 protein [Alphaproteobacteria bacterium]|nr:glycosyltransferase family 2 protein [Alphaproteobacteria bacterium]